MEVLVRPHILSNRAKRVEEIDFGMTIADMVWRLPDVDERIKKLNLAVLIDGVVIPRTEWNERRLTREDERVEIAAVLNGGGGGGSGKQVLALVATVLLAAVAGPAAGALTSTGGLLAGASTALVKAGILLIGTLAINAIFAPPKANNNPEDKSAAYGLSGQSNQARRYGRLPRVYGRHRIVPDVAALPYTVNEGDETFLYVVYSFGYGPLALKDFRIGENPISNYRDVDMVVHENFTASNQLTLYKRDVWQDSLSFELKVATGVVDIMTQDECDRAVIDISFPSGLGSIDRESGETLARDASMKVTYRPASGGSFVNATLSSVVRGRSPDRIRNQIDTSFGELDVLAVDAGYSYDTSRVGFAKGRTTFKVLGAWTAARFWIGSPGTPGSGPAPTAGKAIRIGPYNFTVQSYSGNTITTTTGMPEDLIVPSTGLIETYYTETNPATKGLWELREHTSAPFNTSATITFPSKGQWEIRIQKLDADHSEGDTTKLWRRFITAIKSFKNEPAIVPEVPMTVVELRIRASGQLNGTIDQFSAVATSKLRTWNGSAWVVAETRNPAWVYLDILTGTANPRPVADSRIDLDAIKDWATRNSTVDPGFSEVRGTCDIVVDRTYTIWELLQSVATTGRAAPHMRDNKYSVIIDDATRVPVQMFTPRNSSNLKSVRTYVKEPHALKVRWIDPGQSYKPAEIIVYNTGYSAANATEFEELNSFGMTRPEQVTRWGRYMLAQGKLRQERFTIDTDIENIVCTRGDLVLVAHDVIEVGGEAARIEEIDGNTLHLDAPPTLDSSLLASAAGVRVRTDGGEITSVLDVSAYSVDSVNPSVTLSASPPPNIGVGDLLVFGPKTSVVGEYVVDFIRPKNELAATIGMEELAPSVYTAESTGVIPGYTPPGGVVPEAPPVGSFTASLLKFYDDQQAPRGYVQLTWSPQQGTMYRANYYRVFELTEDGAEIYLGETVGYSFRVTDDDGQAFRLRNITDFTKVYRVIAYYEVRGASPPMDVDFTFVVEDTVAPVPVDTFAVSDLINERRRYSWGWTAGQPSTIVGVLIRYVSGDIASPDWNTMTVVGDGSPLVQSGIELAVPLGAGTFTFLCRAVDQYGVQSTSVRTTAALTVSGNADMTPPPAPSGVVVTGGVNVLFFEHDAPTFTMGRGYSYTQVYAAKYSGAGPLPIFSDASPFSVFSGSFGTAGAEPAVTYHVWMAMVSLDGGIGAVAGGLNGFTATTTMDPDAIIDVLDAVGKPFLVLDVPTTINGVLVPAGTYIRDAAIHEATIGTAHIQDASITDAKIATLHAGKIIAGTITTDKIEVGAVTAATAAVNTTDVGGFTTDTPDVIEVLDLIEFTGTGVEVTVWGSLRYEFRQGSAVSSAKVTNYLMIDGAQPALGGVQIMRITSYPVPGANDICQFIIPITWRGVLAAGAHDFGFRTEVFFYDSVGDLANVTAGTWTYVVDMIVMENKV